MANITIMPPAASIFDSKMKCLVNPVNTQGRSGKGLALEFAKRYPEAEAQYVAWCKRMKRRGGEYVVISDAQLADKMIIYACTKEDPRAPSKLEWIEKFLYWCRFRQYAAGAYNSFAIPALGCGLGGLKWDDVRPLIEAEFENIDCEVELYLPR